MKNSKTLREIAVYLGSFLSVAIMLVAFAPEPNKVSLPIQDELTEFIQEKLAVK